MLDFALLILLRLFFGLLNLLPLNLRLFFLTKLLQIILFCLPRLKAVSIKNLALAFPDKTNEWYSEVLKKNAASLARLLVDFARLDKLDRKWVQAHVQFPFAARFAQIQKERPEQRIVVATGHLGSFELLAHSVALMGYPLSYVVRDFKLPRVDRWWRGIRERYGNRVISRKGAFKDVLRELQQKRIVALLFDQNVTRNHAVFVPWFGKMAATSKALALAALRSEALVLVATLNHLEGDNYRIEVSECDFSKLYADQALSADQKVQLITQRASQEFEKFIVQAPHAWFWMHRRWKTTPAGVPEDFYA